MILFAGGNRTWDIALLEQIHESPGMVSDQSGKHETIMARFMVCRDGTAPCVMAWAVI